MTLSPARRRCIGAAILLSAVLQLPFAPGEIGAAAAAASDGLTNRVVTTYSLLPEAGLIRVRLDVTATAHKPNYYFFWSQWTVQKEATKPRIVAGGRSFRISKQTRDKEGRLVLRIAYPNRHNGKTHRYSLEFDLPGTPPRAEGYIRAGRAFARFYLWAWGDAGDIRVVIPSAYKVTHQGDVLAESTSRGNTVLAQTKMARPYEFFATITAEQTGALIRTSLDLPNGKAAFLVGSPEDPEWNETALSTLGPGLAELEAAIGLPWPVAGELQIIEEHEGRSTLYINIAIASGRLQVDDTLDRTAMLREAARLWFNERLFSTHWINEGFAAEFAARAGAKQGIEFALPEPDRSAPSAVALNGAFPVPMSSDPTLTARRDYAYAAAWYVINVLVADLDEATVQELLRRANEDLIPYKGGPPLEVRQEGGQSAGSHRFLDLVEEVGGKDVDDVFAEWVLSDGESPLLESRAAAREKYKELATLADGWLPPLAIRGQMADWNFDVAVEQIEAAKRVIESREAIEQASTDLGTTPSRALRDAYESAAADLSEAQAIADSQLASLARLRVGIEAVAAPRDAFAQVGLWNEPPPELGIERARAAFASDQSAGVDSEVSAVTAAIGKASDDGLRRVALAVGIAVAVLILLVATVALRRRSRRRSRLDGADPHVE